MVFSVRNSVVTLRETLKKDIDLVSAWGRAIDSGLQSKGFSKQARIALYTSTALPGAGLAAFVPLQALGILPVAFLQLAPFMRDNRHKRANVCFGAALLAPQLALLGAGVGALQVAFAGIRAQTMNVINDDSSKTRVTLGAAFWVAAAGISLQAGLIQSPPDLLPLMAMTCGVMADACSDRMTHIARAFHIAGGIMLTPYHIFVSGSWAAASNETIAVTNNFRTAVKNDLPIRDEQGKPLQSLREQFAGWIQSVRRMERVQPDHAGHEDPFAGPFKVVKNIFFAGPKSP